MYGGCSSTKKVNLRERAMTDFHETWYMGSVRHKCYHVDCRHLMHIFNSSFAYFFGFANNSKAEYQRFIWATVMKLGMWVDVDSGITHVFCCY